MSESNGDRIRQIHGNNENDQSQFTVDAQPLSSREQTSPQPVERIISGACFSKDSQQFVESISSEGESIQINENVQGETWFSNKRALDMPSPSGDWCLNNFLTDLAKKITDEELNVLKGLFNKEIGRGILEKLTTPMAFFDTLRTRLYLDKNNLLYLQTILMKLNRPELIQMAIEYAQREKQVIHFNRFTEEQVNGYKQISVHVDGVEFRQCKRSFIEDLRTKVSALLFIPPQNVLIAGIEPSSSLLITILIPDIYADIVEWILEHRKEMLLRPLAELYVDIIMLDEKEYSLKDATPSNDTDDQQVILRDMFEQFQDQLKQLERTEHELQKQKDRQKKLLERNRELEMTKRSGQLDPFTDQWSMEGMQTINRPSLQTTIEEKKNQKVVQETSAVAQKASVLLKTVPPVQPDPVPTVPQDTVPTVQPDTVPTVQQDTVPTVQHDTVPTVQQRNVPTVQQDTVSTCEQTQPDTVPTVQQDTVPTVQQRNVTTVQVDTVSTYKQTQPDTVPTLQQNTVPTVQQDTVPTVQQDTVPTVHQDTVPTVQQDTVPTEQPERVPINGSNNVCVYKWQSHVVDTSVILPVQTTDRPLVQPKVVVQNGINGKPGKVV